ncbi:MaoC/PaaZ C-terminal domain-containing protein [unidentified bacterial endosymbiont]|jgi:MaoC like domain|uniref:MaoC/PaaZ C-terminal domain-containing protein n=1 Tax=unidentified bacterial endosymbiont TaxID=2355 RepID=UPI00209CF50D|nr:MaoC/PaaZ C-terminal domain-containing protein [unidentified bacterial endosymbiont]
MKWTSEDAQRWAVFSGDHNPIHFDRAAAQAAGADDVTVHGMRAMWDLKQQMAHSWKATRAGELHCGIRLRQPLLTDTSYALTALPDTRGVQGEIRHSSTGICCFSGRLEEKANPFVTPADLSLRPLKTDNTFRYPFSRRDWCYLDALLFKLIVDAPESMAVVHRVLPELQAQTLGDVFLLLPIVQTHHDIWLTYDLFSLPALPPVLTCAPLPSLVMGDRQNGFILQMRAACLSEGKMVMTTAVTLKTWPVAVSN